MVRSVRRFRLVLTTVVTVALLTSCGGFEKVSSRPETTPGGGAVSTQASSEPPTPHPSSSAGPGASKRSGSAATVRYLPLGDSITDGFETPGGYRTALWRRLVRHDHDKIDFVGSRSSGPAGLGDKDNEGHPGWCIAGSCGGDGTMNINANVRSWVHVAQPDIVSIHLGTNDLRWGASGATVAYRLDVLVRTILQEKPTTQIVLVQIVPMGVMATEQAEYDRLIPRIAARYQTEGFTVRVADLSRTLSYPRDYADPLHPSARGYDKMAAALYPVIASSYAAAH